MTRLLVLYDEPPPGGRPRGEIIADGDDTATWRPPPPGGRQTVVIQVPDARYADCVERQERTALASPSALLRGIPASYKTGLSRRRRGVNFDALPAPKRDELESDGFTTLNSGQTTSALTDRGKEWSGPTLTDAAKRVR